MEINKDKLKEFFSLIKEKNNIKAVELIEKDFYLNLLLAKLNLEEYTFKGGTCLAKAYLDYFRFSEDLDFTFANQKLFENKSTNQIKKICKEKIDGFGRQLEAIGLDFAFDKSDRKYVELGNNNKLVTFKVWYESVFTNAPSFVKIQVNFLEIVKFDAKLREILPLLKDALSKEDKIYFQEFLAFYEKKKMLVYDVKEIVAEKIRSLLTRKAIKSRDAIDLFFIYHKFGVKPEDLTKEVKDKIVFAIKNYEKYRDNLILNNEKVKNLGFSYDEVKHLVIKEFKKEDFEDFTTKLKSFLQEIIEEVSKDKK